MKVEFKQTGILPSYAELLIKNLSRASDKRELKQIIEIEINDLVCDFKLCDGNISHNGYGFWLIGADWSLDGFLIK